MEIFTVCVSFLHKDIWKYLKKFLHINKEIPRKRGERLEHIIYLKKTVKILSHLVKNVNLKMQNAWQSISRINLKNTDMPRIILIIIFESQIKEITLELT